MPELRKDPIVGRWVIISTDRGKRPTDFTVPPPKENSKFCPFCYGNEDKTPHEVLAYRPDGSHANTAGWKLRVVPNKFPALQIEGGLDKVGEGVFDKMNGVGAHEVIIETPNHKSAMENMSVKEIEDIFWAFRDRTMDLRKDKRFKYILIFKNHGQEAGASLEHTHSQLIALPIIPKLVGEELDGSLNHYKFKERCIYCDIIRQELSDRSRVIIENRDFITISPFAPRFPFETWILPKAHDSSFEDAQKHEVEFLSIILKDTLLRMGKILNHPPYNLVIHTSPLAEQHNEYYHWHIEIMPKLTQVAGFEWGTGFYINPTPPETAAKYLREAEI